MINLNSMTRSQQLTMLQDLNNSPQWDIIIIGGGITGAGTLLSACQAGLKALLIEQKDFAWGASSKSSKMVHGGLRYLGSGQYSLTKDAVTERQKLLNELPGLVEPLQFLMGHYKHQFPGPLVFNTLLTLYDWIGGKRNHRYINNAISDFYAPGINLTQLKGATQFADAVTDDARLVMRILQEAQELGGTAINYLAAKKILKDNGKVTGISVCDNITNNTFQLHAKVIVNATGPWTDELRQQLNATKMIRPLRGSHLLIPRWRLPLAYSISYFHPDDKRPIFAFPWENATVIGTTDLDHSNQLSQEPSINQTEVDYLLTGINQQFPTANICEADVISTFAGIRPVVSSKKGNGDVHQIKPSDEKREHSIWDDQGLISVAGGKLTTFRLIALDVLAAAKHYLPNIDLDQVHKSSLFKPVADNEIKHNLYQQQIRRLKSTYGKYYSQLINQASDIDLKPFGTTKIILAEIKWVLEHEMVVHLDDLLLRRSRLGLLTEHGGAHLLEQLKPLCQNALRWNEQQWQLEVSRYKNIIQRHYSLPCAQSPIDTN